MSLTCWLVLVHRISISTLSFVPAPCTEQVGHHNVCTWNTWLRQNFTHNYPSAQRGSPKTIPGLISINIFLCPHALHRNRSDIAICAHGTYDYGETSAITITPNNIFIYHHVTVVLWLWKRSLPPKFTHVLNCPVNVLSNRLCIWILFYNAISHPCFRFIFIFFSPIHTKRFTKDNNSWINSRMSLFKSDTPKLVHKTGQYFEFSIFGVHCVFQRLTPHTPELQLWLGLVHCVHRSMSQWICLAIMALCRDQAS